MPRPTTNADSNFNILVTNLLDVYDRSPDRNPFVYRVDRSLVMSIQLAGIDFVAAMTTRLRSLIRCRSVNIFPDDGTDRFVIEIYPERTPATPGPNAFEELIIDIQQAYEGEERPFTYRVGENQMRDVGLTVTDLVTALRARLPQVIPHTPGLHIVIVPVTDAAFNTVMISIYSDQTTTADPLPRPGREANAATAIALLLRDIQNSYENAGPRDRNPFHYRISRHQMRLLGLTVESLAEVLDSTHLLPGCRLRVYDNTSNLADDVIIVVFSATGPRPSPVDPHVRIDPPRYPVAANSAARSQSAAPATRVRTTGYYLAVRGGSYFVDPPVAASRLSIGPSGTHVIFDGVTHHLVNWIGTRYPNVMDFVSAEMARGICRRIQEPVLLAAAPRLTSDSRLLLVHRRGLIRNWKAYRPVASGNHFCPRSLEDHASPADDTPMCAGVWWNDIEGSTRPEGTFIRPEGVVPDYEPAVILSIPLVAVTVEHVGPSGSLTAAEKARIATAVRPFRFRSVIR